MKNFIMLFLFAAIVVAISACNTENPITSDNNGTDPSSLYSDNWNPNPTPSCDYYHRDRERGGPNGYDIVVADRSIFGIVILCRDPGYKYCPTEIVGATPQNGIPTQDMRSATNYAYGKIVSGILTGLKCFPETGLTVRWSSTSPDTTLATSSVKVWESTGTEPN